MNDILDQLADEALDTSLTEEEYARLVKLELGIAQLTKERDALKDRAKADWEHVEGITKGSFVAAGGKFDFSVVNNKDLEATAEKFPIEQHPDKWIVEPQLDLSAIPPKEVITTPALRLSIKKES